MRLMRVLVRPERQKDPARPDGYTPSVTDKTGLYSADIYYDAEFERWIRMGEETDQYSAGTGRIPMDDPWYRIVSGCALKTGLEGARSR